MFEKIEEFFYLTQDFLMANWPILLLSGMVWIVFETSLHSWWHRRMHRLYHNYLHHIKWTVLQLRFPKENLKSPKSMEQVIASLHGTYSFGIPWRRKYFKGTLEDRFSLEIVGRSTGISFYARVMSSHRNMFEAAFFSQYPEVEIMEVPDYMNELPKELPDETYTLFGVDYVLDKSKDGMPLDAYPLKTYQFFDSPDEDQRLDPMATLAEAVSNLKSDEIILLQLLIAPTGIGEHPNLKKGHEEIVNKITGREKKKKHGGGILSAIWSFTKSLVFAFVESPEFSGEKAEERKFTMMPILTPIEQEVLKAVENKLSKNLFETIVRFVYIDRKDAFTSSNVAAVFGAITQFSERNMNSLGLSGGTAIWSEKLNFIKGDPKKFFKARRLDKRRRLLYKAYRERQMPLSAHATFTEKNLNEFYLKTSVMSAEELATIFHPPGIPIGAQKLAAIEMKKGGPPSSLPIID